MPPSTPATRPAYPFQVEKASRIESEPPSDPPPPPPPPPSSSSPQPAAASASAATRSANAVASRFAMTPSSPRLERSVSGLTRPLAMLCPLFAMSNRLPQCENRLSSVAAPAPQDEETREVVRDVRCNQGRQSLAVV